MSAVAKDFIKHNSKLIKKLHTIGIYGDIEAVKRIIQTI